ncbi:RNA polymerase sigma factor [Pedobacter heparinus]|uniref:RNA polymerase sigma-70 factor n=1 Tax=Pedobacter heparinus (strain ATCC 13125 / DSM 2366 / CIP 104194 / JCM 7457 / NBRC 12017 / NCIMB 9290 / NRRL B-14731 / HIM 762-3) TaxID=485917 RepID=C6Y0D6_PEDHD|nr:RNA polymerase sigma-70 factor [Pedobacter heparinus]ACU04848.1 RNA polymerase sigma-70 factor [Pedobacter heparinus DSM 2366]
MKAYSRFSDTELADLLKSGDRTAFTEIFNRYNSLLYIHAFKKFNNKEEARDAVQEAFAMIWAKRETLMVKSNLVGYLYTCVQHKILDQISRNKTARNYLASLQNFIDEVKEGTDDLIRLKQLSAIIDQEINALPNKMREIFELSRKKNLSHKEIAAKLNISEETVKSQVKNALKILRVKLGLFVYLMFMIRF